MSLRDDLQTAAWALASNTLRSALTSLGIVIGVGSVIMMGAVGAGARFELDRQIGNLGTNILVINPTARPYGGRSSGVGANLPLSENDLAAIEAKVDDVIAISGQLWASATVTRGRANTWTRIWGVHEQYLALRNWPVLAGRAFTTQDISETKRVALVGASVAKVLFGRNDPIDQTVRIRNVPFTVIGTLIPKGKSFTGDDHDDNILVPMTTARRYLIGYRPVINNQVGQISVRFADGVNLADAQEDIEQVLRQTRRISHGDDDTFAVGNLTEVIKARTAAHSTLGWLLGATAAISLVVGGVGIMNIMLASVAERSREIGLRKAVGAGNRDIALQFLIEAVALCVFGGIVGVLVGIGGAYVAASAAAWPVLITPSMVFLALFSAAGTGLIFGWLPALRAAALHPIESLRSD